MTASLLRLRIASVRAVGDADVTVRRRG